MAEKIKIGKASDFITGSVKTVTAGGKKVAIARVDDELFAVDDTCTHAECSLGTGFMENSVLVCPCHGSQFEISTGKVMSLPATIDLATYKIETEGDDVYLIV